MYSKAKAIAELRIPEEDKLERARFSQAAYKRYLAWELEVKKPDFSLVRNLYERAVKRCYYDAELWSDYIGFLVRLTRSSDWTKSLLSRSVQLKASKRTQSGAASASVQSEDVVDVCQRAARNVPTSGELAATAIRALVGTPAVVARHSAEADRFTGSIGRQ